MQLESHAPLELLVSVATVGGKGVWEMCVPYPIDLYGAKFPYDINIYDIAACCHYLLHGMWVSLGYGNRVVQSFGTSPWDLVTTTVITFWAPLLLCDSNILVLCWC